eukprot:g14636.t1
MSKRRGRGFVREDLDVIGYLRDRRDAIQNGIRSEEQVELFSVDDEGRRYKILVPEARSYIRRLEREHEERLRALGAEAEKEKQVVRALELLHGSRDESLRRVAGWSFRGNWKGVHAVNSLRQAAGGFMIRRQDNDDDEAADLEDKTHLSGVTVRELGLLGNFDYLAKLGGNALDAEHNRLLDADKLAEGYYAMGAGGLMSGLPENLAELEERARSGGVAIQVSQEFLGSSKINGQHLAEWASLARGVANSGSETESSSTSGDEEGDGARSDSSDGLPDYRSLLERSPSAVALEQKRQRRIEMGEEEADGIDPIKAPPKIAGKKGRKSGSPRGGDSSTKKNKKDKDSGGDDGKASKSKSDGATSSKSKKPKAGKRISFAGVDDGEDGVGGRRETLEDMIEREMKESQARFMKQTGRVQEPTEEEKEKEKQKAERRAAREEKAAAAAAGDNAEAKPEDQQMRELPDSTLLEPELVRSDYVVGVFQDPLRVTSHEPVTRWQRVSLAAETQPSYNAYLQIWDKLQSLFNGFQLNLIADFFITNYISQLDTLQRQGATDSAERLSYAWMDLSTLATWIPLYLRVLYPKADLLSPNQSFRLDMYNDVLRIVFCETPSQVRACIRRVPFELACVILEVSRLYWMQYAENCGFDAAETGELNEIFHSFDMDDMESGGLRAERIFDVLEQAGFVLVEEERALLGMLYRQCDQDGNGYIDFNELLYILRRFQDKRLATQMVQCASHMKHLPSVFLEEYQYLLEMDAEPKATDHDIVQMYNLFDLRMIFTSFDFDNMRKIVQRFELSRLELGLPVDFNREQACRLAARVHDEHDELVLEWARYLASKPPVLVERGLEDVPIPQEIRPTTLKEHVDEWSARQLTDEARFRKYIATSAWVHDARKIIGALMKSVRKRNWLAARMKGKQIKREQEKLEREAEKEKVVKKGKALLSKGMMAAKLMKKN